mmetsp:Transcript_118370/g.205611  ORF Transcript_118370/g.205611 Transcript_118370/m.205611 type:complete len:377 (-) Transcript_118370:50-1180(-)
MARPAMDILALACLAIATTALRGPCNNPSPALRGPAFGMLSEQTAPLPELVALRLDRRSVAATGGGSLSAVAEEPSPVQPVEITPTQAPLNAPSTPCPCLSTPPPLVPPDEAAAREVIAAADEAMGEGIAELRAAANASATLWMKSIEKYDMNEHAKKSQSILQESIADQNAENRVTLDAEYARQQKALQQMQKDAQDAARASATKVRETAALWAAHQAQQSIVHAATGTVGGALTMAQKAAKLRQEATALAAQAISSARQTLSVAQEAENRSQEVTEEVLKNTEDSAEGLKAKQQELMKQMNQTRQQVELASENGVETQKLAEVALDAAKAAEMTAQQAYDTAKSNSEKVAKLKDRATAILNKAQHAGQEGAMLL